MQRFPGFFILFIGFLLVVSISSNFNDQKTENTSYRIRQSQRQSKKSRISDKQVFQLHSFLSNLKQAFTSFIDLLYEHLGDFFSLTKDTNEPVIYRQNFASEKGGAQILMVSSSSIKSPKAILSSQPDAYLFTADILPIVIVIGLKQQILMDSFSIKSGEVYSRITEDFLLEGKFLFQNQEWMHLGNFTAENSFEIQQFAVEQKIIRYIRLTILSSYGKWKYFTLSQVKVYGKGLLFHAIQQFLSAEYNIKANTTMNYSNIINSSIRSSNKLQNSNKKVQAKQILVKTFEQIAAQGKQDFHKSENHHNLGIQEENLINNNKTQQLQIIDIESSKSKKSLKILKKKIHYLEKRNFQLDLELKELKNYIQQKFISLLTTHQHVQKPQNWQHQWYAFLFRSQTIVAISAIINVACLSLVVIVLRREIFSNKMSSSLHQSEFPLSQTKLLKTDQNSYEKKEINLQQKMKNN